MDYEKEINELRKEIKFLRKLIKNNHLRTMGIDPLKRKFPYNLSRQ